MANQLIYVDSVTKALPAAVVVSPSQVVTVKSSGGDQTAAIQAALDVGGTIRLGGAYTVSAPLVLAVAGTSLELTRGSVLTTNQTAGDALRITAADVTVRGGTITSPATFSGTNVEPTYAVIRTTAARTRVEGVRLVNVPKVGIFADDTDDLSVTDCLIEGNYPAGSWTGTETGHFGIAVDPGTSGTSGRTVISGNTVRSCVQGVFLGNYGATATGAYGTAVTGNVFDGCHNHGVYNAGGLDGCTVTGNTFARCSLPVAMTGAGHVVSSNAMFTHGTGNNLDLVGISMREPVNCAVIGNVLRGDAPAASVVIELGNYTGTAMSGNVVSGNTIEMTAGTSVGIRLGRDSQTDVCNDNVVSGNVIRGLGRVNVGLITLAPKTGAVARGNKITGNSLVVTGESHGIYVGVSQHTTVQGNSVRFEYDAPSAKVLAGTILASAVRAVVTGNDYSNVAGFGANVTLRGTWESTGSSNNTYAHNRHDPATGLTAYTPLTTISGSDCFIDENATGTPSGAVFGIPGSRWARLDGGASTSLYVKETASTSATWRAI